MKKIHIYIVGLIFTGASVQAQNFSLGVRGGLSIPNLTSGGSNENPLNTGYSSRQGADAAITAEYRISGLFSLEAMAQYSSQGGKKDGLQALPTPQSLAALYPPGQVPPYLYANYKSEAKLNYFMIPILAKFGWNFGQKSPWRIYVDAGPFFGFLLSGKQVTSGQSPLYSDASGTTELPAGTQSFNNTQDITSQLNTFNFGVEGNIGLSYTFGGQHTVFVEAGGNYGFLNIQKYSQDGTNNTGAATVDVGYSFWFKKRAPKKID